MMNLKACFDDLLKFIHDIYKNLTPFEVLSKFGWKFAYTEGREILNTEFKKANSKS